MRTATPLVPLLLAAAALISGCSSISQKEFSRVGTAYSLTHPACHADFADGTSELFPGKCITVVRPGSFKKIELQPGTCLKLGEARMSYPDFSRRVIYDVEVAGHNSTISLMDSPRRPWKGMVESSCTPVKAPVRPLFPASEG